MRIKPKRQIMTREAAEAALARLNQIDTALVRWCLAEAEAVAAVRQAHAEKQRDGGRIGFEAEKALLVKELEEWAKEASATWERKTLETSSGRLGFRMTTPSVVLIKRIAKKFENAVELLMLTLPDFVRTVYEVDKEKILATDRADGLDREALNRCGLDIYKEDEFWVETGASKDLDEAAKKLKSA